MQTTAIQSTPASLLTPEVIPADGLTNSIAQVVGALTGKTIDIETTKTLRLTEDLLYTAIVHQRIESTVSGAGSALLTSLNGSYGKNVAAQKRQPLSGAVDTFLNSLVKKKQLTNSAKESLIRYAFGKAQLDNSKTTLARNPENPTTRKAQPSGSDTITVVFDRVAENKPATTSSIHTFADRLSNNKKLTKQQSAIQADVLQRIFPSPQSVAAPPTPIISTSQGPSETDSPGPIPDPRSIVTGPDDFAYKPESELDGKLVVMVPRFYRERAREGSLVALDGETEILKMKDPRYGDDQRPYFRSDRSGKEFEGGAIFRLTLVDGSDLDFTIPDLKSFSTRRYA